MGDGPFASRAWRAEVVRRPNQPVSRHCRRSDAGAVEAGPEVRGGDPEELLDLLRAEPVQLAEEEGVGEARGEPGEAAAEGVPELPRLQVAARLARPRGRADPPVAPAVEVRLGDRVRRRAPSAVACPGPPCGSGRRSCASGSRRARSARSNGPRTSPGPGGPPGTSPGRRPPPGRATGAAAAHSDRGSRRAGPPSPRDLSPRSSLIGLRQSQAAGSDPLPPIRRPDATIPDRTRHFAGSIPAVRPVVRAEESRRFGRPCLAIPPTLVDGLKYAPPPIIPSSSPHEIQERSAPRRD